MRGTWVLHTLSFLDRWKIGYVKAKMDRQVFVLPNRFDFNMMHLQNLSLSIVILAS